MKWLRMVSLVALAGRLVCASDSAAVGVKSPHVEANAAETSNRPTPAAVRLPRVLRSLEPKDSGTVTLPGAVVRKPAGAPVATVATAPAFPRPRVLVMPLGHSRSVPVLAPAPEIALARGAGKAGALRAIAFGVPTPPPFPASEPVTAVTVADVAPDQPGSAETDSAASPLAPSDVESGPFDLVTPPAAPRAKLGPPVVAIEPRRPDYPAGLAQESAVFCQREIGHWTLAEAKAVLGEPQHQRAAIDGDSSETGRIYAFRDPTSRYKQLELDFGKDNGLLRSVFIYPWNLTWIECRRLWGARVSATEGAKGRVFYSYVNRHLDVLVDHAGKVISLGLY